MITEDYVSFEIAKLLKEKGFCENTEHEIWYVIKQFSTGCHWNSCTYKVGDITREYNDDCCIPMPTLQMAMKWLRKVHNIHIAIVPCEVGAGVMDYTYILYKVDTENFIFKNLEIQGRANTDKMSAPKTCEAAIKYCLENLI